MAQSHISRYNAEICAPRDRGTSQLCCELSAKGRRTRVSWRFSFSLFLLRRAQVISLVGGEYSYLIAFRFGYLSYIKEANSLVPRHNPPDYTFYIHIYVRVAYVYIYSNVSFLFVVVSPRVRKSNWNFRILRAIFERETIFYSKIQARSHIREKKKQKKK